MIQEIYDESENKMKQTLEHLRNDLARLRTGKATPAILDGITVDYYGTMSPIKQMANISIPEPRLIMIQPWDRSSTQLIEKAIMASDLGLNPSVDGPVIRLTIPALTEERRKELVKISKRMGEDTKIAVRNIRRDANDFLKTGEKDGDIPQDDARKAADSIQKKTDDYIAKINDVLKTKEDEIMEV